MIETIRRILRPSKSLDTIFGVGCDLEMVGYAMLEPDEYLHVCRVCGEWLPDCPRHDGR